MTKVKVQTDRCYQKVIKVLHKNKIPFLIGGTFAIRKYTGIDRETPDMDIFCKASNILEILKLLTGEGFRTELSDARWIGKAYLDDSVIDFIFGTPQGMCIVDDSWFEHPHQAILFGQKVRLVPPEEIIWSKSYRQDRFRYEGPDINHLILKLGSRLNWHHLLSRMEPHWEILFAHLLNFRFTYPTERNITPSWLMKELMRRLELQISSPLPKVKVCRGPLLAIDPYKVDITEWGFKDIL